MATSGEGSSPSPNETIGFSLGRVAKGWANQSLLKHDERRECKRVCPLSQGDEVGACGWVWVDTDGCQRHRQ